MTITDDKIAEWYNRPDVAYYIPKHCYNREFAAMRKPDGLLVRQLVCHNSNHFQYLRDSIMKTSQWQYYHSTATYTNGLPRATFNERPKEYWRENHWKEMQAYDLFIDIDGKSLEEVQAAHTSARLAIARLQATGITRLSLRYSGMGFHITVPYSELLPVQGTGLHRDFTFEQGFDNSIYDYCWSLCFDMHRKISEMIDTRISDARRIQKAPGSLSIYDKDIFVCHEFSSLQEFEAFNLENYRLQNYDTTGLGYKKPTLISIAVPETMELHQLQ